MAKKGKSPKKKKVAENASPKEEWSPGWFTGLASVLLIALVFLTYSNSLRGEFVFDDRQIIEQNSPLINIETLDDALAMGSGWRRLTAVTYGLNFYWGQLDPYGYHLVNVLIHALNAIVVFLIISQISGGMLFPSLAGAAVFSVHPLLSEAVANVAGRASSLCALFYFLSVLGFLKALDSENLKVRAAWLSLAALSGFVAFQAKQEAIALPVAMAGLVWIRSAKKDWRYLAPLAVIPIGIIILIRDQLAALFASVMGNRVLVSAGFEEVLPVTTYIRTYTTAIVGYYFPRFLYPSRLTVDPHIRTVEHWYSIEFLFALVILGSVGWFLVRPKVPGRLFGAGVVLVMLSPLTAYVAVPLADVVLEHRAYISGLGLAVLAAALFDWLRREYGNVAQVASLVLVVAFTLTTVQRNTVWADGITLWEDAESKYPGKPRPHFNLAESYQRAGRLPEAIEEYEHALDLKPDIHAAYSNMAAIYLDQGDLDQGEEVLLRVTGVAPDFTEGFINLGVLYIRRREPDKALEAIERALALNGDSFPAHFNKGETLTLKGDFELAVESYQDAVDLRPDLPAFQLSLGVAHYRAGDSEAAESQFRALFAEPEVAADAHRNLGSLYAEGGDDDQALEHFERATKLRAHYPDAHHDLGAVYLRKEMTDLAIREFETTITQQADYGPAHLNLALAHRMKGNFDLAVELLETYLRDYGSSGSPYVPQAEERLRLWQ